jgi:hypothetical protein
LALRRGVTGAYPFNVKISRRELWKYRRTLVELNKQFCVRDGCEGHFDVVAGSDDRMHLICPVCGFSSAEQGRPQRDFAVGDRVRCVGYPIVGAGTVVEAYPLIGKILVKFDRMFPPRDDFAEFIGDEGTIGVSAMYMERLYP